MRENWFWGVDMGKVHLVDEREDPRSLCGHWGKWQFLSWEEAYPEISEHETCKICLQIRERERRAS
jgi:hypothetical protein